VLGEGRHLGAFLDELGRELRRAVVATPDLAYVRLRRFVQRRVGLTLGEELADPRFGRALVDHPGELRQLEAAVADTARRHLRTLVPAEDRSGGTQQ
jgi:hypothetical protein